MTEKMTELKIKGMVESLTDDEYFEYRRLLKSISVTYTLTDNRTLIETLFGFEDGELFERFDKSTTDVIIPYLRKGDSKKINKLRIKRFKFRCEYDCDIPDFELEFVCRLPLSSVKFACETAAVNHLAESTK